MREVFPPVDPALPPEDDIFYTIRREDVGKTVIPTTDVSIPFVRIGGRVLKIDVGKRVFGHLDYAGWHWSMESSKQRDQRTGW